MERIIEFYSKYRDYILFLILLVLFLGVQAFIFWYFSNEINTMKNSVDEKTEKEVVTEEISNKFIVDIKGEVKTPGVYILEEGKRVIDVVRKAGGFTKSADTSANNLSMKIFDEMVIVIYSKTEIKNYLETKEEEEEISSMCNSEVIVNDSCVKSSGFNDSSDKISDNKNSNSNIDDDNSSGDVSNGSETKLVSINTASKEELMTLSGIGESKADAIIEYREAKKFETIEELKEVSGIGDALFEKIKDFITV